MFRQPLMMISARVVQMSVATIDNSLPQDFTHPNDQLYHMSLSLGLNVLTKKEAH